MFFFLRWEKLRFGEKRSFSPNPFFGRVGNRGLIKKRAAVKSRPLQLLREHLPTLPRRYRRSTIGLEELNFRIRNGNGCIPLSMNTPNFCEAKIVPSPSPRAAGMLDACGEGLGTRDKIESTA